MRETNISTDSLNRCVKCNNCDTTLYAGAEKCTECGGTDIDEDWNSLVNAYQKHDIGEAYFVGRMHQIGLEVEYWGIDMRDHDDGLIFDNKMDLRLWEPLDSADTPERWPSETDDAVFTPDQSVYEEQTIDGDPKLGWEAKDHGLEPLPERTSVNKWELRGIVDVKTKSSESWMGKFNLRHLCHYAEHAAAFSVPTFLYMTMVDMDEEQVGEENVLVPIPTDWDYEQLVEHYDPNHDRTMTYGECKDTARTCPMVERTFRAPDGNLVVDISDEHKYNFNYLVENVL